MDIEYFRQGGEKTTIDAILMQIFSNRKQIMMQQGEKRFNNNNCGLKKSGKLEDYWLCRDIYEIELRKTFHAH
jgi:hypothetical protein